MNDDTPLIAVHRLGRRRAGGNEWLLRDVSLRLCGGDRLAIVGPSGAGKSLLLRAIAQLDAVDEGEVLWNGRAVVARFVPAFRRHVIYLQQRPAFCEGTVEENLREPYRWKIHRHAQYDALQVEHWLSSLGRDASFLGKSHADLSGGEAQLMHLLRAVQLEPEVLLLDEPTAALDAAATTAVEQLVDQWMRQRPHQRAFIWVSHDEHQLHRVTQRVLRIHQGQLTQ